MTTVAHTANGTQAPASTCVASLDWDQALGPAPLPATSHTQRWHAAVSEAARQLADAPAMQPRLAAATQLVLADAVTLADNGASVVKSGATTYTIEPETGCPCADAQHRSKYCKHYVAAGLQRVARRIYAQDVQKDTRMETTPAIDETPEPTTPAPAATPAPEPYAPSTLCLKARVGDVELSWTLRGTDEDVAARAQRVLAYVAKLQAKQPCASQGEPPTGQAPATAPQCPLHGAAKVKRSTLFAGYYCAAATQRDEQGKTYCKWTAKDN
jgi:hypothetical protein